ncbi:MAG: hypothetical protein ACI87E_000970 [Mariniblastus sp.]|jgi:hypothetical protein
MPIIRTHSLGQNRSNNFCARDRKEKEAYVPFCRYQMLIAIGIRFQ